MPSRTRTDVVYRAAGILGLVQAGQDLDPESAKLIDDQYETTLASLAAREVIYLLPSQAVTLAIFEELAACLAANCPDFGQGLDGAAAEERIRFMQRRGPTYEVMRAEYF